jgi:hypothetical protein
VTPAQGSSSLSVGTTRVSSENKLAYVGARRTQDHTEDGDEPRRGTRSISARRSSSHRRRMRRWPYRDNPARIRPRH